MDVPRLHGHTCDETRNGGMVTGVLRSPPGWNRPFGGLSLQTLTQGSDPFSLPTEKLRASSHNVQVYVLVDNVFMLLPVGGVSVSNNSRHANTSKQVCTEG